MGKWMKRLWIEIVLAAFIVACGAQAPALYATTLNITLTYTYSSTTSIDSGNNYPACAGSVMVNCITGFNIYDTTNSSPVLLGKVPNPSSPSGTVSASTTLTLTNPTPGTHTAVARTAYVGSGGTAAESVDSAPATFQIQATAPGAPASLSITVGK
jgi:hypothetical protein